DFKPPAKAHYVLVSSLDAISALRRDTSSLVDAKDLGRALFGAKTSAGLADLPDHAVLDRGRVVGLWQYDADRGSIACAAFGAKDKALAAAVAGTEAWIRGEVGDARSFSLDSPKSRAPRIEALRQA